MPERQGGKGKTEACLPSGSATDHLAACPSDLASAFQDLWTNKMTSCKPHLTSDTKAQSKGQGARLPQKG